MPGRPWTISEDEFIRENYWRGVKYCQKHLPYRSYMSIRSYASRIDLTTKPVPRRIKKVTLPKLKVGQMISVVQEGYGLPGSKSKFTGRIIDINNRFITFDTGLYTTTTSLADLLCRKAKLELLSDKGGAHDK